MSTIQTLPESHSVTAPARVILADDHDRFREGLLRRFDHDPRLDVVGSATEGHAAVALILRERPDVAVLDLRLTTLDALEVHDLVADVDPELASRIMVLTADATAPRADEVRAAIDGPVMGKDATRGDLADAVAAHAERLNVSA